MSLCILSSLSLNVSPPASLASAGGGGRVARDAGRGSGRRSGALVGDTGSEGSGSSSSPSRSSFSKRGEWTESNGEGLRGGGGGAGGSEGVFDRPLAFDIKVDLRRALLSRT